MGKLEKEHFPIPSHNNNHHKMASQNINIPIRDRISSESSNGDESFDMLEPLELDDLTRFPQNDRQRFDSVNEDYDEPIMDCNVTKLFSVAMALRKKNASAKPLNEDAHQRAKANWKRALRLIQSREDPWAKYRWDELPVEKAIRHRYNALTKKWKQDEVVVKMAKRPFGKGAMRECFRMKKLSNFSHNQNWDCDSNNYVAKRYMEEPEDRHVYFEDVKLQMDAKLWAKEFNRHNPPKKVDIFMMSVFEFPDRPKNPFYHIEHFIDGEYIKYNSNSGFVENTHARQTPHAFSHFTFERSGHELIVVDVQGVGDLYTDPQIHTARGNEYGEGNLGPKGMALFFHSHSCNSICRSLGLSPFDLSGQEKKEIKASSNGNLAGGSKTVLRGNELICGSPTSGSLDGMDLLHKHMMGRVRTSSMHIDVNAARKRAMGISRRRTYSDYFSIEEPTPPISAPIMELQEMDLNSDSVKSEDVGYCSPRTPGSTYRMRHMTESSDDSNNSYVEEMMSFEDVLAKAQKPSCINDEMDNRNIIYDDSVLGQVHLELAKYHEVCRFAPDGQYDKETAFYHLKCAAKCGIVSAIVTLAKMYNGMPHDLLSEVDPPKSEDKKRLGFRYAEEAANAGERASMVYVARAFDTGLNLDDAAKKSAATALIWYERICELDEHEGDDSEWGLDDPPYMLLAWQAEILLAGEDGVKKNPTKSGELYSKAAESAMACMKGKLANKYYMLAEQAWAECDDEEEEERHGEGDVA